MLTSDGVETQYLLSSIVKTGTYMHMRDSVHTTTTPARSPGSAARPNTLPMVGAAAAKTVPAHHARETQSSEAKEVERSRIRSQQDE